jgi:radical SAM PhpK family P-methyltransferase
MDDQQDNRQYDCIVIGHNEPPFERYENLIRRYGLQSPAYRDLRTSFVTFGDRPMTYLDLLNGAHERTVWRRENPGRPFVSGDMPHLAAAYLTNFLRRHGSTATYISLFQNEKDRLRALLAGDPLCVAITTTLYVLNFPAAEIVDFVRACNPRVKIVIGGPLVANHSRVHLEQQQPLKLLPSDESPGQSAFLVALEDLGADIYVIEGQGELTLARVVQRLKTNGDLSTVPNLAYRENGVFHRTAVVPEENDLNTAEIDWRHLLDAPLGPTIQTRTARSCAFKCAFCNYPTRAGKLSLASIDTLVRELDSMRDLGGVQNVVFIDDTFNVPLERFKEICRTLIQRAYGFNWFSYFRCSNSDEEAIDLMARSGCKGVFLGIESGSRTILNAMNKAASVEKYEEGIRRLKGYGIATFASFIVGFPGETADTVAETEAFIRGNAPDFYRAQLWYCEAGTPVVRDRAKHQIQGEGFQWSHATMDNVEAMDHVERLLVHISESEWLPQWSFDFWILPYLLGRGISISHVREFAAAANRMLKAEIAGGREVHHSRAQRRNMDDLIRCVGAWYKAGSDKTWTAGARAESANAQRLL